MTLRELIQELEYVAERYGDGDACLTSTGEIIDTIGWTRGGTITIGSLGEEGLIRRYREALQRIASEDYRGSRPSSSRIAEEALAMSPTRGDMPNMREHG
jgi:hypothetical protein